MGEHKHNPTAIAAKNGELKPKPKGMGKRETERYLQTICYETIKLLANKEDKDGEAD